MNANVLFKWRREHLRTVASAHVRGATHAMLLPVNLANAPSVSEAVPARPVNPADPVVCEGVIEIDVAGARIRLRGSVDESNLRCVLQMLATA